MNTPKFAALVFCGVSFIFAAPPLPAQDFFTTVVLREDGLIPG